MLLGQQSIALVAHGERARRIRHYLFTLEQQPRSFLRRLIASLGHDRRFRRIYRRGLASCKAVGVAHPDAETIVVTFYRHERW